MGRVFSIMFFQPNYWGFHAGEKNGAIFSIIIFQLLIILVHGNHGTPNLSPFVMNKKVFKC